MQRKGILNCICTCAGSMENIRIIIVFLWMWNLKLIGIPKIFLKNCMTGKLN